MAHNEAAIAGGRLIELSSEIGWIFHYRAGAYSGRGVTARGRAFVVAARPSGKIRERSYPVLIIGGERKDKHVIAAGWNI
jgi:hypothetical protein